MNRIALILLLLPGLAWATDPPKDAPPKGAIHFPNIPNPPTPPSPPSQVTKVGAGQLYVITSDAPLASIDADDDALVKISNPTTPVTIIGTFVDAMPTDDDGRTYAAGTSVYIVRAAGVGKVKLIIHQVAGDKAVRKCLDVDNGAPPAPPPTPPTPPAPTDPLTVALQAAYSLDADADKAQSLPLLKAGYAGMASKIGTKITDPTTNAVVVTWMQGVIGDLLTPTQLVNTRKAIGAELSKAWGTTAAPLTIADAAKELQKIATSLGSVK